MRSAPGSSEFYVTDNVEYSMRLTDHGEYLHAAPWSEGAFGSYANSHGCISMSTANARDLWNMTKEGDVVVMTAPTGFPAQPNNGISVWNESWDQWLADSATGERSYGPTGPVAPVAPAAPAPAGARLGRRSRPAPSDARRRRPASAGRLASAGLGVTAGSRPHGPDRDARADPGPGRPGGRRR